MASRIVELRDQIVNEIKAKVPVLKSVDWWDGAFHPSDLDRWTTKTPAAMVSVLKGNGEMIQTGEISFPLRIVTCIVTSDKNKGRDSNKQMYAITEELIRFIPWNRFTNPNSAPAINLRMEPLTDPMLRDNNMSMMWIEWEQTMTLGRASADDSSYFYGDSGDRITQVPQHVDATAHIESLAGDPAAVEQSQDILAEPTFTPKKVDRVIFPPSY
jgi:hypothetical protein